MSVDTETEVIEQPEPEEIDDGLQTKEETETAQEVTAPEPEPEQLVVTIGDAEPEQAEEHAPSWVRDLRKQYREAQRELRELKARAQVAPDVPQLGKKPTLEDFDYDSDKFESALVEWHAKKQRIDAVATEKAKQVEAQERAWAERLQTYAKQKQDLRVPDFEDAEIAVQNSLSQTQQGILLDAMDNPALLVAALGKNPSELQRLAAITSPTKFLRELSRIEDTKLKTAPRKPSVAPEKGIQSSAPAKSAVSNRLDALKVKAEKTGDYTEYFNAKNAMKK
jgi:hypothetical protein